MTGGCLVEGCERANYGRGLCSMHYVRHRRTGAYADLIREATPDLARSQGYERCCDRCQRQLGALAGDSGRGDRPLLAASMTMAEASAYMLGFFDRRSAPEAERIDPYIVARFHELRTGAG